MGRWDADLSTNRSDCAGGEPLKKKKERKQLQQLQTATKQREHNLMGDLNSMARHSARCTRDEQRRRRGNGRDADQEEACELLSKRDGARYPRSKSAHILFSRMRHIATPPSFPPATYNGITGRQLAEAKIKTTSLNGPVSA